MYRSFGSIWRFLNAATRRKLNRAWIKRVIESARGFVHCEMRTKRIQRSRNLRIRDAFGPPAGSFILQESRFSLFSLRLFSSRCIPLEAERRLSFFTFATCILLLSRPCPPDSSTREPFTTGSDQKPFSATRPLLVDHAIELELIQSKLD